MVYKPKFFEHGGGGVFLSMTNTRTSEIDSVTSHTCILVADWAGAIKALQDFLAQHRFFIDQAEIFTKPRLCEKCLRHATQPLVFDKAKHVKECLCYIEKSPCSVHK